MLAAVAAEHGSIVELPKSDWAPADRFQLPDGTVFGIIASTTTPFCATCDRSRITADGMWYRCLYARVGTDLREPLRRGANEEDLAEVVRETWRQRRDRGAVDRLKQRGRTPFVSLERLRVDPHLEMHTRGG
jgi:GTP 3',8-cyclase